jgi:uncharacterized protein YkwD
MRSIALALIAAAALVAGCGKTGTIDTGPEINRADLLMSHNLQRAAHGSKPLQFDPELQRRAQAWAEHMAQRDSLVHSTLDIGSTGFFTMGENIAMGYGTVDSVVDGWMDSPGHRRNILNPKYNRAGFGYARRPGGAPYWCAQFGGR